MGRCSHRPLHSYEQSFSTVWNRHKLCRFFMLLMFSRTPQERCLYKKSFWDSPFFYILIFCVRVYMEQPAQRLPVNGAGWYPISKCRPKYKWRCHGIRFFCCLFVLAVSHIRTLNKFVPRLYQFGICFRQRITVSVNGIDNSFFPILFHQILHKWRAS